MARLPDATELGGLPAARSGRPLADLAVREARTRGVATRAPGVRGVRVERVGGPVDTSAVGSGARALGASLDRVAGVVEAQAQAEADQADRLQFAKAKAQALTGELGLRQQLAQDGDYTTVGERYGKQIRKVYEGAAGLIGNPDRRALFEAGAQGDIARFEAAVGGHVRRAEADANVAYVDEQADRFIGQAGSGVEEDGRRRAIDSYHELVDGLHLRGFVDAGQALAKKRSFAKRYASADYWAAVNSGDRTRMEDAVARLRGEPGSEAAVTDGIVRVEGRGRNPRSSAAGVGQFTDETWLAIVKAKRPQLAEGRSDAEVLALRADDKLGWEMTDALRRDNKAYLAKKGADTSAGAQYLAHFLGPAGAVAVLKAPADEPVADVLSKALGKKRAAAMIAANPEVLGGQLTGSVAAWAGRTMGGGDIYDVLRLDPVARQEMVARGTAEIERRHVKDQVAFGGRVEDIEAEVLSTGQVSQALSRSQFVAAYGPERGLRRFQQYEERVELGRTLAAMKTMPAADRRRAVESLRPQAAAEGFALKQKAYEIAWRASAEIDRQLAQDPAAFAVTQLPVAKEAYGKLSATLADDSASPADRRAAAETYARSVDAELARIGVPAVNRTLLPKAYVDQFAAQLNKPAEAGGTANVAAAIEREASLWGARWPQVYRELAKNVRPVARVIGSGVKPAAAQILADVSEISTDVILKGQADVTAPEMKKEVVTAFGPLAKTMAGNEGAARVFEDFRAQGEKLAAFYVARGMDATVAAEKAFDDLVGHKYDFSGGTYRVPKGLAQSPEQIAAGVEAARGRLVEMIEPPRDTVGGLTPEYLTRSAAAAYARDGVWVTAPDESGLALIYADQAVRRRDGGPLVLSWTELAALAGTAARERLMQDAAP